jgi:hypothetical protein
MTKTFNKIRSIELLKKDQSLENKNSSLYKEDRIEYRELLSYGVILYNQIIYNQRHDYISLIEKYVTNEIDSLLLKLQFFQIQREDKKIKKDLENNIERLSNVLIDSKSDEFSLLIADIFDACEALKSDSEPEEAYGITELQFRAFLKKTFLQMKKYSDK